MLASEISLLFSIAAAGGHPIDDGHARHRSNSLSSLDEISILSSEIHSLSDRIKRDVFTHERRRDTFCREFWILIAEVMV